MRTCIGCNLKKPKKEMIRIVITPMGNYEIDNSGKKPGRGVYLCYNPECLSIAIKKNRLNGYFKKEIILDIIDELKTILKK
ncbi:MAG: YlxR family protein [Candidatus Caldatribacteriota bacterium]|nr:YlxR family protein [Candidatus Caldatribacteriota bacterium]